MAEQSHPTHGMLPALDDLYTADAHGIYHPPVRPAHREDHYPSPGFDSLLSMQRHHFWYRGRHRFILHYARMIARELHSDRDLEAIDLGGGCGGWVSYLQERAPELFPQLALADSSVRALEMAERVVSPQVKRYHVDLLNLRWRQRWDVAFLLDVLEHIADDGRVLREVRAALRPGGYLIVTSPAFERFRTRIDDMSHHVRRYSRRDLVRHAAAADMELVVSRYFLFFLSPLLLLSRRGIPDPAHLSPADIRSYLERTARIPPQPVNSLLSAIFSLESPLGAWVPFPWGTSVLAVLRRP